MRRVSLLQSVQLGPRYYNTSAHSGQPPSVCFSVVAHRSILFGLVSICVRYNEIFTGADKFFLAEIIMEHAGIQAGELYII